MPEKDILLRSFMFLPAYNRKFIEKALCSKADAIILDMEDSVPWEQRQEARSVVIEFENQGCWKDKTVFVRINPMGTKDFVDDVFQLALPGITGFMPSKIMNAGDIIFLDRFLQIIELKNNLEEGKFLLAPLIETTSAIADLNNIANSSQRLVALCLGGEDYLNDLGSTYTYQQSALTIPRALLANAARNAGILPIDTPYLNLSDMKGFEENERLAYKNGFAGCLLINPRQIDAANAAFSPNMEQVAHAQRVIDAVKLSEKEAKSSVAMLDGVMVGPPMRKRAQLVLDQNDLIKKFESKESKNSL